MSSYVCPRCGKKGPALLRPDQLCQGCMSNWAWGTTFGTNQVVKITPEAVAASEPKPATKATPAKTSWRTWVKLTVSLLSISIAVVLLVCFFKYMPSGVSGQELIRMLALGRQLLLQQRHGDLARPAVAPPPRLPRIWCVTFHWTDSSQAEHAEHQRGRSSKQSCG